MTVSSLAARIREEIRQRGPLPFARFMERALYEPDLGYYARGPQGLGPGRDFVTASDAGHELGRCLVRQVAEVDRLLGPFEPCHVVEFGAGRGLLARDVLDAAPSVAPELAQRLRYVTVDRSPGMREAARRAAPEAEAVELERLGRGYRGCVVAVELFDALPVHWLRRREGRLREVHVDLDAAGRFVAVEGEPDPDAARLAERYGAAAEEGSEAEVAPAALAQLDLMLDCLERGVVIVIDYGDPAPRLYGPERPRGTLLAYSRHVAHERVLERPGEQDLTAHVNFSALIDRARERGAHPLTLTTQDRFLLGNGLLEAFAAPAERWREPEQVRRRLRAMQLIHPSGMGRTFRVLLLACGCDAPPALSGAQDPFRR